MLVRVLDCHGEKAITKCPVVCKRGEFFLHTLDSNFYPAAQLLSRKCKKVHIKAKERVHIYLLSRRCKKVHLFCADKKSYEIVFIVGA